MYIFIPNIHTINNQYLSNLSFDQTDKSIKVGCDVDNIVMKLFHS